MKTPFDDAKTMLLLVAKSLGQEMLDQVAFVGGCTTCLLITDELGLEFARYTDDVDLIVDIVGRIQWHRFQNVLRSKGFSESAEDTILCRMRLGELKVDFMPHDGSILGFTNRWYEQVSASMLPNAGPTLSRLTVMVLSTIT
jgi:predicted nucleotidyltransferase